MATKKLVGPVSKRYCIVDGVRLTGQQRYYCSDQCKELLRQWRKHKREGEGGHRSCVWCRESIEHKRADAITCGKSRCRTGLSRFRKRVMAILESRGEKRVSAVGVPKMLQDVEYS